jgi:hypothetical protein
VPDSYPGQSFSSIAAVGFGLTAYGVGVERGYITRGQAAKRTLATLRFFAAAPQNGSEDDAAGYHGFFYHFLDMKTGKRAMCYIELSSVDTTLLLGGVPFAQSCYDHDTPHILLSAKIRGEPLESDPNRLNCLRSSRLPVRP